MRVGALHLNWKRSQPELLARQETLAFLRSQEAREGIARLARSEVKNYLAELAEEAGVPYGDAVTFVRLAAEGTLARGTWGPPTDAELAEAAQFPVAGCRGFLAGLESVMGGVTSTGSPDFDEDYQVAADAPYSVRQGLRIVRSLTDPAGGTQQEAARLNAADPGDPDPVAAEKLRALRDYAGE